MPLAASRRRCTTTVQFLGRLSRRQITKLGKHLVTKLGKHWSQVFGTRLSFFRRKFGLRVGATKFHAARLRGCKTGLGALADQTPFFLGTSGC